MFAQLGMMFDSFLNVAAYAFATALGDFLEAILQVFGFTVS